MSFSDILNRLMDDNHTSNNALGKAIGVSDMAVSRWRKQETVPSLDNAIAVASYYGLSLDDMAGNKLNVVSSKYVTLPVIGFVSVMGADIDSLWAHRYLKVDRPDLHDYPSEECYILEPRDDTLVQEYVQEISYPIFHQQHQCANGDTVLIRNLNTRELMFKKYKYEGDTIVLSAPVPGYKDIVYRKQDVNKLRIEAVVIETFVNV